MAITTVGFDNADITEGGFARLMAAVGKVCNDQGVTSGMVVSPGGGTRQVSISAGEALAPGVLVNSGAATTLTLAANSSGATRADYVVLEVNWSANTAAFVVVQGASATPPALTQTAGTLWQLPLARVAVPNGATSISSGNITVCKPIPRVPRILRGTVAAGSVTSGTATLATVSASDPGWPYRLEVVAQVRMQENTAARARVEAVDAAGAVIGGITSAYLVDLPTLEFTDVSSTYTDATTATLQLSRSSGTGTVGSNSGAATFYVKQIPA